MSTSKKARNVPAQFLGAFKKGHRYSSREMIDEELSWELLDRIEKSKYTDSEAIEALTYITRFNNEFHKNVIKKDDPKALHNTDELRRDCYARENAKNRDIMSIQNKNEPPTMSTPSNYADDMYEVMANPALDKLEYEQPMSGKAKQHSPFINNVEDAIIGILDNVKEINSRKDINNND